MYLLDTDILLNLMKRAPPATLVARLAAVSPEEQFTSTIALGELVYAAQRLRAHGLEERLERTLMPNLPVLPFEADAAKRYGELRAELEKEGICVGDVELRIAAAALARGLTVATGKAQRFQKIPGLAVESWLEEPAVAGAATEEPVGSAPVWEERAPSGRVSIEFSLGGGSGRLQSGGSAAAEDSAPGIRWTWPPESRGG